MTNQELAQRMDEHLAHLNRVMVVEFGNVKDKIDGLAKKTDTLENDVDHQNVRVVKLEEQYSVVSKVAYFGLFSLITTVFTIIFGNHKP